MIGPLKLGRMYFQHEYNKVQEQDMCMQYRYIIVITFLNRNGPLCPIATSGK